MRTLPRRFIRLALGFSKKLENLVACVAFYMAHYNFCRWHRTLKKTPAMAAKITGHLGRWQSHLKSRKASKISDG